MSDQIIVTSTTDSPEAVNAAVTAQEGDTLVQSAGDSAHVAVTDDRSRDVEATATENVDSKVSGLSNSEIKKQNEETQREIDEEKQARTDEYLGKSKRKLLHQVSRLTAQKYERDETITELRQRLAQYEGQSMPAAATVKPIAMRTNDSCWNSAASNNSCQTNSSCAISMPSWRNCRKSLKRHDNAFPICKKS